jgi:recombination protein RecA
MAKTNNKAQLTDELGGAIAETINKQFKSQNLKTAYFLEGDDDAPTIVKEWVSTGSTILDLAISNRKNGGFPVGRVCEITGLEQSGKSLLAAHTLLNTQKKGGLAVYIDTENALSTEFLSAIGLNLKEMLYIPLETVEDIFETVETIIEKVRSSDKNRLVTIVVDSIAGASTKTEMAADFDKDGYATAKALIISKAMRKITNLIGRERICLIFTNQLRQKLNAPAFSDPWTTPGGKGIPFHASVRIRLSSIGAIKAKVNGQDTIIGSRVKAKLVKNRVGPPLRECEYEVYFDSGIDDYSSWLTTMKDYGLVGQSGAWYSWTDKRSGEIIKFQSKEFVEKIINVPELAEIIYDEIADKVIMKYQQLDGARIDDVVLSEDPLIDDV